MEVRKTRCSGGDDAVACQRSQPLEDDELYVMRARVLKALASPVRLKIIDVLAEGELTVTEITERVGAERSNVSRHLAVLTGEGILLSRKEGLHVYYELHCPCVLEFFGCAEEVLRTQLDTNRGLLEALEKNAGRDRRAKARQGG